MKKYTRAIAAFFLVLIFATFSMAADLEDSFMGYKWGEDISQYAGLTELYAKGDVVFYRSPGQSYTVDGAPIDNAIFGFYKGSFFAVYIGVDNLETYDKIKMHMKLKYGLPGTKLSAKDYLTTNKWKYKDIIIKLKIDDIGGKMKLAFYYSPISREIRKNSLDKISETSFKFFPIDKNKKPEMIPFLQF